VKAQGSGDAGMADQGQAGQTSQGLFAPGREPNSRSGAVTTVTLVLPSRVEFWQESPDGLHDRIRYCRGGSGWIIERLSP
jgi:Pyridoxine 5'-phosphate oxidase C-terminal dimerisation region